MSELTSSTGSLERARAVLLRVARETATARRLQGDVETELLQSVVDAAAALFEAEAASIALFERDPDRLVFRVAAGARGDGVIGLSVPPGQGIVGHVFSSGEAVALSDVASDPRFDRDTARRTGYQPRSIAAVPLVDAGVSVGVLQVLDKRSSDAFSLRDMDLLSVFANQAAAAIQAARAGSDPERLLRDAIAAVAAGTVDDEALDALVGEVASELDRDAAAPFWKLVDAVAGLQGSSRADPALVGEILAVAALHHRRPGAV